MRFPIYPHSANPAIDSHLCRKSLAYCNGLVERGEGYWLPERAGVHLFHPDSVVRSLPNNPDDSTLHSIQTPAAISDGEVIKNAQFDRSSRQNPAAVVRAFNKVKFWNHPKCGDTYAVRVNGLGKVVQPAF